MGDLFHALRKGLSLDVIRRTASTHPHLLLARGSDDGCLLHAALHYGADLEVVRYLVKVTPQALAEKDIEGSLPAHVAAAVGARFDVLRCVVDVSPQALLLAKNGVGRLPLHLAVEKSASARAVRHIVGRCPAALRERDPFGRLPLHVACSKARENPRDEEEEEGEESEGGDGEGGSDPSESKLDLIRFLVEQFHEALREGKRTTSGTGRCTLPSTARRRSPSSRTWSSSGPRR
jgi:hypothetical protein